MPSLQDVWNVTRLRLLVELEKCSSLSQAAEAVGVSQPSASEHIRLLNAAAGEPIVERYGRSLRLTHAGRVLAVYASQALSNLTAGESALAARAGLRTGTLELGASSVIWFQTSSSSSSRNVPMSTCTCRWDRPQKFVNG